MALSRAEYGGEPDGTMTLNGRPIDVIMECPDIIESTDERAACVEHLAKGAGSELINNFWLAGCVFPEEGEEQLIRYQVECKGPSIMRKICRLTIIQYDRHGKVITKFK